MAEFDVQCEECNSDLSADFIALGRSTALSVGPCEKCMKDANLEGYQEREAEEGP